MKIQNDKIITYFNNSQINSIVILINKSKEEYNEYSTNNRFLILVSLNSNQVTINDCTLSFSFLVEFVFSTIVGTVQ